jgi:hypothetical protein
MDNLIFSIWFGVFAVWFLWPLVLGLFEWAIGFWTRWRIDLKLVHGVYEKIGLDSEKDAPLLLFMLYHILPSVSVVPLVLVAVREHPIGTTVMLLSTLALVFGPRILMDVAHSIRYNFKTKDSDRIKAIEEELKRLRGE